MMTAAMAARRRVQAGRALQQHSGNSPTVMPCSAPMRMHAPSRLEPSRRKFVRSSRTERVQRVTLMHVNLTTRVKATPRERPRAHEQLRARARRLKRAMTDSITPNHDGQNEHAGGEGAQRRPAAQCQHAARQADDQRPKHPELQRRAVKDERQVRARSGPGP